MMQSSLNTKVEQETSRCNVVIFSHFCDKSASSVTLDLQDSLVGFANVPF